MDQGGFAFTTDAVRVGHRSTEKLVFRHLFLHISSLCDMIEKGEMKLPHHESAVVPQTKITGYLLSPTHRDGRSKADFFTRFGFSADSWEELATALLRHAADHEVTRVEDSPFGTRYVVEGTMPAPDGRAPAICSIWFIETGEQIPQFVTAYPLRRRAK